MIERTFRLQPKNAKFTCSKILHTKNLAFISISFILFQIFSGYILSGIYKSKFVHLKTAKRSKKLIVILYFLLTHYKIKKKF